MQQYPQQSNPPGQPYGVPHQPDPAQAKAEKNGTLSMILGLCSIFCVCLTGIPAAVFGVMALTNPAASKGARVRAWIGIGTGIGLTIIMIIAGQAMQSQGEEIQRRQAEVDRQARIAEQERQQAEAERLRQEQAALAARQQAEREAEQARFEAMPPADHLSAASSALEANNFSEVERHLAAIPSESDQADQVDRVRREVPRRRLALAREALDNGYDRSSRTGGDLATAETHLRSIGENDREAREAQRLLREIEGRRARQQEIAARLQREEQERAARAEALTRRCGERPIVGGRTEVYVYLHQVLNDPSSMQDLHCLEINQRYPSDNCWVTTCEFRARNGFGALILQRWRFYIENERVVRHSQL